MPPIIITDTKAPKIPKVTRAAAADDAVDNLPRGVELTGGSKLRKKGLTGKGVRVAVIDSGVDEAHPGFDGKVTYQLWLRYGTDLSEDDHGTHVAGTIHMLAPDAEIYDYRVFGKEGWEVDDAISTSIFEACFDGCDIINMSLGGRWPSVSIRTAVQYAYSKGVIVVCAAGNEGDGDAMTNERSYPAMWDEAISVAAVSKEGDLPVAYFSNTNPQVDYSGIGVDALSFKPGGGNQVMSGTSMACPHVCGLIAALLDKTDGYDNILLKDDKTLRKLLKKKFLIDIGVKGPDNETGLGFLTFLTKQEFDDMCWRRLRNGYYGHSFNETCVDTNTEPTHFDSYDSINISLGGRLPNSSIKTAVQYAHSKDVIGVCAAGNWGDGDPMTNELSYPAMWDEAISVATVCKETDLPVAYWSSSNPQLD